MLCINFSSFFLCRSLGPSVGGAIYAWSVSVGRNIGFPLDVNLVFIIFGFIYFMCNVLCAFMPRKVEIGQRRAVLPEVKVENVEETHEVAKQPDSAGKSARI